MSAAADNIKEKGRLWHTLAGLSVVAAVVVFYYWTGLAALPDRVREMGYGAETAVAIILLMGVLWAFALPASAFLFVTPLLFPPHLSAAITTAGCALGTAAGYMVGRFIGGSWVERFRDGRLARFLARHSSFLALFSIRLTPSSPHGFINYAAGLARIPPVRFVLATTAALALKSYVYAYAIHNTIGARSPMEALSARTTLSLFAVGVLAMLGHVLRRRMARDTVVDASLSSTPRERAGV